MIIANRMHILGIRKKYCLILFIRSENNPTGEQFLKQALLLDGGYRETLYSLIQMEIKRENWGKAATYIQSAISRYPYNSEIYYYRGIILHQTG